MKIALGTAYYLSVELMKTTCVPKQGAKQDKCDAGETRWSNSFFMGSLLFFGMSFTLIPYFMYRHGKPGVTPLTKQTLLNMLVPSLLEFIGQIMFLMGIKYIPMSLSLTLKGGRVVFSALLLVLFLGRKLRSYHWWAVAGTMVGLVVSSIPSLMHPKGDAKTMGETMIGIGLVLGGEFIRSLRTVVEEKLMKKLKYDALLIVGLQGLTALLLSIPILFAMNALKVSGKPIENLSDSWNQFASTPMVWALAATFPISVSGLFISGAYVTKLMSAVHNALTTILTNGLVWGLMIAVFFIDKSANGKSDKMTRGERPQAIDLVQLLGFAIVLVASLVYDAILRLPFFTYPLDRAAASGAGSSEKSVLGITESSDNISEATTKVDEVKA
jgi:drug/metabolite transporter (DMT)-like permease